MSSLHEAPLARRARHVANRGGANLRFIECGYSRGMPIWTLAASLLLAAQGAPALPPLPPAPSAFDAVAADVAFVTDVCYRLTTGELRWAPRDINEEMALVEAAGLTYGVPNGVIDTLGPAGRVSVNR